MKVHTTNYFNTLILIAEDSPSLIGQVPPKKDFAKTAANIQHDLIAKQPYTFTSDEILFRVFSEKNELLENELGEARIKFFSKGQACLRASPLSKRYGWGIHSDENGKVAIYGAETEAYKKLMTENGLTVLKAMKSAR